MEYSFAIHGHPNILSTHSRTVEFTKDSSLTRNGDCILGVKAGFELRELKKFLGFERVRIVVAVNGLSEALTAIPNKGFSDNHEMVIRLGEFSSARTFAVRADRAAAHVDRRLVSSLREGEAGTVTVTSIEGYRQILLSRCVSFI